MWDRRVAIVAMLMWLTACQRAGEIPEVPMPDLSDAYVEVKEYLAELRSAIEAAPESANAWGQYAMALDAHEYASEAIECYRMASRLNPRLPKWKYLLARKLRNESPDQAESLLSEITGSPSASLAELILHADILTELGRIESAQELLRRVESENSRHPAVLFRQANSAFNQQDLATARAKLSLLEGRFRESNRLMARLEFLESNTNPSPSESPENLPGVDESIVDKDLRDVLGCRRDPLWLGKRAAERANTGDQLSLVTLTGLVAEHPELIENRLLLAFLLAQYGDPDKAEQIVGEGLALSPEDSRLLAGSAGLAIQKLDWTIAEERLRRLLKFFPEHEAGWSDLAFVLEQQARLNEALDAYDTALRYFPRDEELISRRNAVADAIKKGRLP